MCYGGCDCQRCSGEPPVIKTPKHAKKPIVIFDQKYEGFESLQDWDRDMSEAIQDDYNPAAKVLNGEFEGTLQVIMVYTPKEKS